MKTKYKNIQDLSSHLPERSYSKHHELGPPISLLVLGRKKKIIRTFQEHGWFIAVSITPISAIRSGVATILSLSYRTGPMYVGYVDDKPQQLGFERPTHSDTFKRRHHLRLWKTKFRLNRVPVWVGTISYDSGVGLKKNSLIPIHHTSPTLRLEEDYLAKTFEVAKPLYIRLANREEGIFYSGDKYIWDGLALVLDLRNET